MLTLPRYLRIWLLLTGALILAVAAINLVVDPYGLFRLVDRPGFNAVKPKAGSHGAMAKAYQVVRVAPRGLVLGNSRAEVGFDPEHPAWPAEARPVYNLALPGTATSTSLATLRHALAAADRVGRPGPAVVVWGVDFVDFLVAPGTPARAAAPDPGERRLSTSAEGVRSPAQIAQMLRDYAEASFTLAAFADSLATLASQGDPYAEDLTPLGFNPMRDYVRIARDEGYAALFRQKDADYLKAFRKRPTAIYEEGRHSRPLDDFRQVVRLCRERGIELRLVIYPYHARFLEIVRISGHWPAFEAWLRALVATLAEEPAATGRPEVPLWGFNTAYGLTGEAVPGARGATMRGYWESGHFKGELGGRVLDRVFGRPGVPEGFGVRLDTGNVEAYITVLDRQAAAWRDGHAADVAELARLAGRPGR